MKPNLLRSIANNLFVKDAFYKKIRNYFIGLLGLYTIMGLAGRFSPDGIEIMVQPNTQSVLFNQPVARYQLASLSQAGQLHISKPNLIQLSLFPDKFLGIDLITLLCICMGCLLLILIIPKLQQKMVFRKDISTLIRMLGFLILFHAIFSVYRLIEYIPNEIGILTNHEFVPVRNFPIYAMAEAYISLVVIEVSNMYKSGMQLKEEQSLTI
jgi:hypothetical protein